MSSLHETQPWSPDYRYVVGKLACKAYMKALSPDNLISAFRRTGIVPINRGKICPVKVLPATIYPKTETETQPSDSKCGEQFLDNLKISTVNQQNLKEKHPLPSLETFQTQKIKKFSGLPHAKRL